MTELAFEESDFLLPGLTTTRNVVSHHTRTVTVQTYIAAASVWGFVGDNHGPTDRPSKDFRTTSTITFDDGNPSGSSKPTSDTGISRRISTGQTAKASAKRLRGYEEWKGPGKAFIYMVGKAKDPLTWQIFTPSAQYELALNVDFNKGRFDGYMSQTDFPSCQLFIDDQRVYSHGEKGNPLGLLGASGGDIHGTFKP